MLLIISILQSHNIIDNYIIKLTVLQYFADILTVAIVADVMPLNYENRSIVKYGVLKMRTSPLTGFSALLNVSGVKINDVTAEKIAFSICPRINAAGRMGSAKIAVELLCESDILKALKIANEIDELNALRQQTEKNICASVFTQIEQNGYCYQQQNYQMYI